MEFSTASANAVLFYNGRYSERRDFIVIRIVSGQAELVFSLGDNPVHVITHVDGGVNTGEWKKVTVVFDNKVKSFIENFAIVESMPASVLVPHCNMSTHTLYVTVQPYIYWR